MALFVTVKIFFTAFTASYNGGGGGEGKGLGGRRDREREIDFHLLYVQVSNLMSLLLSHRHRFIDCLSYGAVQPIPTNTLTHTHSLCLSDSPLTCLMPG